MQTAVCEHYKGFSCLLSSSATLTYLHVSLKEGFLSSEMAVNVPNEVLAFNLFTTSLPLAVNQGICLEFPDTMCIPEMCWNTLAYNMSTTSLRVTIADPLEKCCYQAGTDATLTWDTGDTIILMYTIFKFWTVFSLPA